MAPRIASALNPRSRFTSSIFATTLFASFFVVILPHALPCPAPRGAFADDGCEGGRRRRRKVIVETERGTNTVSSGTASTQGIDMGSDEFIVQSLGDCKDGIKEIGPRRGKRECPIPKPGGLVGEVLGFKRVTVEQQENTFSTSRKPDGQDGKPP